MKKILVVTSKFPWPITGASESDRAHGILQLQRLGYDIRVITKVSKKSLPEVDFYSKQFNIAMYAVPYRTDSRLHKYMSMLLSRPFILDGAAYEYAEPNIVEAFKKQYEQFNPDNIWLDMVFMWPLAKLVDRKRTRVVIRSQNNEALHFLEEEGTTLLNNILYYIKLMTERRAARLADTLFAITPNEERFYRFVGSKNVITLPLRGLSEVIVTNRKIKKAPPFNVYFPCSTFNVKHNKKALLMILKDIAPHIEKMHPGVFKFHIFGTKFPMEYEHYLNDHITHDGTVQDIDSEKMDIALVPSLSGRGMQQKIFEPLTRGVPTITSARGINGYPFVNGDDVLLANTCDDFCSALETMIDSNIRMHLSKNAIVKAEKFFNRQHMDELVKKGLVDNFRNLL